MSNFLTRLFKNGKGSRFQKGYNFAKLEIEKLGFNEARRKLLSNVECSRDFGTYDDFDRGVEAALSEFQMRIMK
jgi:hypothetical protein